MRVCNADALKVYARRPKIVSSQDGAPFTDREAVPCAPIKLDAASPRSRSGDGWRHVSMKPSPEAACNSTIAELFEAFE
jgi:hypothetical protein